MSKYRLEPLGTFSTSRYVLGVACLSLTGLLAKESPGAALSVVLALLVAILPELATERSDRAKARAIGSGAALAPLLGSIIGGTVFDGQRGWVTWFAFFGSLFGAALLVGTFRRGRDGIAD